MRKAQASFEYMLLVGLFIVVLGSVLFYNSSQINRYVRDSETGDAARSIARAVNQIGALGPGSAKVVFIELPSSIQQGYAAHREIVFKNMEKGRLSDMHFPVDVPVYGFLESGKGNKHIVVKAEDNGYVSLSPLAFPNITDELNAFYSFEITNSTHTFEMTGKGRNLELKNEVNCNHDGLIGKDCLFDGNDDYLNVSHSSTLSFTDELSIVAFIFMTSSDNEQAIITKWEDVNTKKSWILQKNNEKKIDFITSNTGSDEDTLTGDTLLYASKWHQVAAVYNSTHKMIYIDGQLDKIEAYLGNIYDSTTDLKIGYRTATNPYYFNGEIDEVLIFNRSLSREEIAKLDTIGTSEISTS